ncbi:uncharacterized protein LOC125054729 isoform X2 [Pieris napi]|uniref:uncharacterized protein LOC125054729 isoform X2 n=1 Tax=Pieris napi TaxID=78633 RepID=UPI001FBA49D3|nr:uncharacterized protein LOC125054729 isoform X2 [Pieris napi]
MLILFLTVCLGLTSAQILQDGQCETIALQNNFELDKFTGKWHGLRGNSILQNGDCSYINFTPVSSGNYQYTVEVGYVEASTRKEIRGTAVATAASFNLTLEGKSTDFNVLNTDYDNYALVYSCENVGDEQRNVYIWELARDTSVSDEIFTSLVEQTIASNFGLTPTDLSITTHSEAVCNAETLNEVILPGTCDQNVPFMRTLNISRFSGEWRLIESYYNERQSGECNHAIYTVQNTGLAIENRHVLNRELLTTSGTAVFASNEENGKLRVTIGSNTRDYWILSTDYESYALAYSCENLANNQQRINSWKLSRTNTLTAQAVNDINSVVNRVAALDNSRYIATDQSDQACFYYPSLSPNEPVILPGQCNQAIPGVGNFNLTRFEGEWRLLSSYYNARQSGKCNRATYTDRGNTMGIVNSHITDRLRSISTGTASTTAESGKLVVNVGTNPPAPFWILATDYENYALAYSCENLPNNQQRISSWKLSRSNTFSAQANDFMNNVINSVDVLNNRYYSNVDQSDEACFYYPSLSPNEPVILHGQCNQAIPGVGNFNLTRFEGEWRLLSSYYNARQSGKCNRATYTVRGNTMGIVNSHIIDRLRSISTGTASTTAESGKLVVNVGTNPSAPFWILATDYENYALAYSCENLPNNQQRISSWKLSRSNTFSAQANDFMNNVINSVDVLYNRYYNEVDQSDEACFHYPTLSNYEPVVLPGQCDLNVTVMPSLNLTGFSGEWRLISSYYNERQSGECNHAIYSVQGTGLTLQNRHVLNRQLLTTSGTISFASTDRNGKLRATVGSNTRDYWILNTDYDSYALAYSCENLANNQQRIFSWKLSRTNTLTAEAKANINAIINTVEALHEPYFTNADQSDDACFYYPDIQVNEPVIFPGQCDENILVTKNFSLEGFLGRWRLISSYYTHRQSGECNQVDYSREGSTIRVRNMHITNSELSTVSGSATVSADGSGKLRVTVSTRTVDFWILATDYDNYALAYSCSNVNANQRRVYSWKLSRRTSLRDSDQTNINNVMDQINVLNERYYTPTDNSDDACFHYPTVDPSRPVVFDGQCNQNIPVVRNFQSNLFLGEWYDVESYPSTFQYGTCNTARYSANGNNIIVNNTQIIDGVVSVREANGVFPEGNNVGKLKVNFGSADRDYWILSTDYDSYALIYSCLNLDNKTKQVGTWKLSRSRQLSETAKNEINSTMSTIRELDQRYFITRNHTEAGCFYHRDQSQTSVIFSGRCDTTITAVPNFNLTAFQGVWHEIQAYPSEMMTGECLSQEYSQRSGSSLNVVQRNVRLETLFERTGVVTQTSNDNSGKLLITVQGGLGATIPFWVLSTDYNDYALAYGCVDLINNERQVYSWKLSRSQQLSAAANTQINNVKATIPVLDSKYYKNIDQSDAACFHLPDFTPGESVILPGKCDDNIPVERNFDAQRYSGVWYQIEKYFQRFETGGNCTGARYTLNSDTGVVTVLNWQVVNGILDTIEGTATVNSTDGSAKLRVRLPIRSSDPTNPEFRETNLYVLDTDYTSYSLAYSCVNLEGNRRQVSAWKLSRARTMSDAGNTAINAYMENRQELQNSYFVAVDQSDSCPEPNSATLVKNSIIMLAMLCMSLVYLS